MNSPTRILLADDHRIIRQGLRSLLDAEADLAVVGEAEDGRQALALARDLKPDVVILDISMPGLNGMETARLLRQNHPDILVLMLSMHADRRFVQEALALGVQGYLLKDSAFEELAEAIRSVRKGHCVLGRAIAHLADTDPPCQDDSVLSVREREVLQLMAEGDNTKVIAHKLSVSVKTVETHRQHIMHKLNIHTVAGLTRYALREGLTHLDFPQKPSPP